MNQRRSQADQFSELGKGLEGDCLSDAVTTGLYATDASVYQVVPRAVVVPKQKDDISRVFEFARKHGVAVLPRGAGTSQNGQTVNDAIVLDNSRYFNQLLELDVENRRCVVQPGMVLDTLNSLLKPHGLWFPVDVSTASRATIGGMAGNNSCGQRSIVYGTMRDNVASINAMGVDGEERHFGSWQPNGVMALPANENVLWKATGNQATAPVRLPEAEFVEALGAVAKTNREEIETRFPRVLRRVGGYNLDALLPASDKQSINLSHLLVGSEGTLGVSTAIELKLSPLPGERVMGVCHFPTFYQAMDAAQHLVALGPSAVELVDSTMVSLAMEIDAYRATCKEFVRGQPEALLLVEFASLSADENRSKLRQLEECMADLGFSWQGKAKEWGGVVAIDSPQLQAAVGEVRKSGLNIMMSMKTEGKPVSFVEDCAVELSDLAEYTQALTEVFEKHGTRGTWYAHASVGCLHVRPVLNLKLEKDLASMRSIAKEAFELVRHYKGSHSGEHGDGISRSEFHVPMFGRQLVSAFETVKQHFDPDNLLNPGRIVNAPRMNDRSLLRYHHNYKAASVITQLDWSAWPEAKHGLQAAVEMCNNNGACRKPAGGVMCPSWRVTGDELHLTRGRANTLRLALSGQLPTAESNENVLASDELHEAMQLCVSCKACRHECPTGVDMAKMKLEVLAARGAAGKHGLHESLVGSLPAYAWKLSRFPFGLPIANACQSLLQVPGIGRLLESLSGFSRHRELPKFAKQKFNLDELGSKATEAGQSIQRPTVILFADTFNRYFDPEILHAAVRVLQAAGYKVISPDQNGEAPQCCGRTHLAVGNIEKAREVMKRARDRLLALLESDSSAVVVGLEPSCVLTFRDELLNVLPDNQSNLLQGRVQLFEEFLAEQLQAGNLDSFFESLHSSETTDNAVNGSSAQTSLLLHGHCHQKAFVQMPAVETILGLIPNATVTKIESSCCGMAGAFGYHKETEQVSRDMAELALLPQLRGHLKAGRHLIVADGTSCRHQISDGIDQEAYHVAQILELAMDGKL